MPPANRIWTIGDLTGGDVGEDAENFDPTGGETMPSSRVASSSLPTTNPAQSTQSQQNPGGKPEFLKCHHIPTLPGADVAKAMLERVVREFEPIVRQRGYNVVSISEMCCCSDGLDFLPNRRRKLRKSHNNIWGYNRTSFQRGGRKSHDIHLRLRHAANHSRFHDYVDVAGTLAHELAHCEHSPHNKSFFKLMDDILDQHATLMAASLSRNGYSMPVFGGSGQALGGGGSSAGMGLKDARRQQQFQHGPGHKLGGDAAFTQWMTPAEAAVVAAESRRLAQQVRLRGDRCCRPCTIIIDEDGDEREEENDGTTDTDAAATAKTKQPSTLSLTGSNAKKRAMGRSRPKASGSEKNNASQAKATVNAPNLSNDYIDLTVSDDDDKVDRKPAARTIAVASQQQWPCGICTFLNKPLALSCSMCQTVRKVTA